jgi:hypothetical protein
VGQTGAGNTGAGVSVPISSGSAFGERLSNDTVEISYTLSGVVSCASDVQSQVPTTFSGGWEMATSAGATGKPENVTLTPLATSTGGDVMNGTISAKGVMAVKGDGTIEGESLVLHLPSQAASGKVTTPLDISGTAVVNLHNAGHPDCTDNWKVTGTLQPPH